MEIVEAIKARKSIRAFLPKPVPREVLEEVLEMATRSPSWANTQPWEVTVIGGRVMEQVKEALVKAAMSGASPNPELPYPAFGELYVSRSRDVGRRLYEALGISREDREKRLEWAVQAPKFFDAPNGFIFYLDEELGPWSLLDLGLFSQSIMLAAVNLGLGTCSLAAAVAHPQVLREILDIPEKKKIIYGMAIGYPDWQHPVNKVETQREPTANFARWCGF